MKNTKNKQAFYFYGLFLIIFFGFLAWGIFKSCESNASMTTIALLVGEAKSYIAKEGGNFEELNLHLRKNFYRTSDLSDKYQIKNTSRGIVIYTKGLREGVFLRPVVIYAYVEDERIHKFEGVDLPE